MAVAGALPWSCCPSCMQAAESQPRHSFAAGHRAQRSARLVHASAARCRRQHAVGSSHARSQTRHAASPDAHGCDMRQYTSSCGSHLLGNASIRRSAAYSLRAVVVAAASQGAATEAPDVVIVGGGLAGLGAALALQKAGVPFVLLEASDGVGGRVRTDEVEGFLLDRGFQIFLTSYPECKGLLDYGALQLQPFYAGATVRFSGGWHRVADPLRHFFDGIASLANPIGSPIDKVRVGLFRLKALLGGTYDSLAAPETSTLQQLQAEGFSAAIIDRFFRPFLGGIFFDSGLGTSSRLTSFVMRMLATGENCLPERGIGALTQQLAQRLPAGSIQLESPVEVLDTAGGHGVAVKTKGGLTVRGRRGAIVAAEGPAAAQLLGPRLGGSPAAAVSGVGTCCLYFAAEQPPSPEPMLYLNGESSGVVNNVCFPSTVSPSYAPAGKTLVSVSTVGTQPDLSEEQLADAVQQELGRWWGPEQVDGWRHLRTYRIPFAQPKQAPPTDLRKPVSLGDGIFVCGDWRDTATFDGALLSGRRAVEALLAETASAEV